jgi:hypothetical protein
MFALTLLALAARAQVATGIRHVATSIGKTIKEPLLGQISEYRY